jgi:hypothetical protein
MEAGRAILFGLITYYGITVIHSPTSISSKTEKEGEEE